MFLSISNKLKRKTKNIRNVQNVFKVYEDNRLALKTKNNNEVEFIKKISQHPHDSLARKTKNNREVQFIKKVLQHPRNKLARKSKPYACKTATKTLKHPRQRLNENAREIAISNSQKIKKENYKFASISMLNKGQVFGLTKTCKDQIFDKKIEGIPKDNDEFYIQHTLRKNDFTVRKEL